MKTYIFILGRKSQLSIAELCSVLGPDANIIDIVPEALIAKIPQEMANPQLSLDRLGGTIKIAEVFAETAKKKDELVPAISQHLITKFEGRENKLNYGVTVYSFKERHEEILRKTLTSLKKLLTKAGIKNRFINKNFRNLESAAIHGEKLLHDGAEIIAVEGNNNYFIAETKALQDIEKYSERDYARPMRDAHLGMLPPKLAQIMINLTGYTTLENHIDESKTVYDPFTGIGTVLTEGVLMGYKTLGSDINQLVLDKAKKNIDWTLERFNLVRAQTRLFAKDATQLTAKDFNEKIDLVVTESYLGPAISQFPLPDNIRKTFTNIENTLEAFFRGMKKVLNPGTPIVVSMLAYKRKDRYFFLEHIIQKLQQMGYKAELLIPAKISQKFSLKTFPRHGIIYDRPDQIVAREIWKFTSPS